MSYLTVHEVASLLRVSELTVRRWVWAGKLPAMRVGRVVRIRQADVEGLAQDAGRRPAAPREALRPGSPAALLESARQSARLVQPGDLEALEALIDEGCERPGEVDQSVA